MKTAIYLEDGVTQVVLTAENDWEKSVLARIDGQSLTVLRGQFYACQGGWFRQREEYQHSPFASGRVDPESLMLRVNKSTPTPVNHDA